MIESKNIPDSQKLTSKINAVRNSVNFWSDAQEFLKMHLPSDFEDKLRQYSLDKGYNQNEFRLFNSMLQDGIGFHATMVLLQYEFDKQADNLDNTPTK